MSSLISMSMRSQLSSAWGNSIRGAEHFPDPFMDMASLAMPENNRTALQWCEFIYMADGTYRAAMERNVAYFLTDIEITGDDIDDDTKEKYKVALDETLGVKGILFQMDCDKNCYGNAFASMIVPFRRYLICRQCSNVHPLNIVYSRSDFQFAWDKSNYEFVATCPRCGYRGPWTVNDQPEDEEQRIRVKLWSPHEIEIIHDPYTHDCAYLWKIPEDYKKMVQAGHLYHLERCPLQVMEAIKRNWVFRFAPDALYHMKEMTLGGIHNRGWGISRIMTNFRQVWYVQVLRRMNEAIALDYVIPFRVITPAPATGGARGNADPMLSMNMGDFMGSVRNMLRKRRRDPAQWNTLPFPVQYQALGGDAKQLAPKDMIDQGNEVLLNNCGIPIELWKGSLSTQSAPTALRLYEATNQNIVSDNNGFLRWLMRQLSQTLSWEPVTASMRRVTHADDMNRQMAILQLMMGQQASKTTALRGLDLDFKSETKQIAQESVYEAEQQARAQEEMQQAGFAAQVAKGMLPGQGGGQPGGQGGGQGGSPPQITGDPTAGGTQPMGPVSSMPQDPNTPVTPNDMLQQADSIAQQLLGQPEPVKDSELRQLKTRNETLHSLVRAKMDSYRSQAKTQGGAAMLQQQFGSQ